MEGSENPPDKQSWSVKLKGIIFGNPQKVENPQPSTHQSTLQQSKILPKTWLESEYPKRRH